MLSKVQLMHKRTKRTMKRRENRFIMDSKNHGYITLKGDKRDQPIRVLFYDQYKVWVKARVERRETNQKIASVLRRERINANS
jgi:hypothetical protein